MTKKEIISKVQSGSKITTWIGMGGCKSGASIDGKTIRRDTACAVIRELNMKSEDKCSVKHWAI